MICKTHGISEIDCSCSQWSEEAKATLKARREPCIVPKRLHREIMVRREDFERDDEFVAATLRDAGNVEAADRWDTYVSTAKELDRVLREYEKSISGSVADPLPDTSTDGTDLR